MPLGRIAAASSASTESVTVVAEGAAVQTESGERSAVITAAQFSDLSSLTRSWTTYMLTIPSVYSDPGDGQITEYCGPASKLKLDQFRRYRRRRGKRRPTFPGKSR
ncbi:MAG TPA: hypothetical protein VG273_24570 [Bryobacteraceae bacterium]|nr:hypothetical protein [Bryobacteraceae bacterium]